MDYARGANCYLVGKESRMLLIDTGMPGNRNRIVNCVRSIGKHPSDISYIVLTHADIDHVGGAAEMKRATGMLYKS